MGTVRAKGLCPQCGEKFKEIPKLGFICLEHKTVPKRCYVDLFWKGQRLRIFSDSSGQVLDSWDRANTVRKNIESEIENHSFDPAKYLKAEVEKYWIANLLDTFEKHKTYTLAPAYQGHFKSRVRMFKEYFGNRDIREIRKIDIINMIDHLQAVCVWQPKTMKNAIDIFKTFMNYCHEDLEIITAVPPFPKIDVPETPFVWLDQKDQIKLFERVPDNDKPIIAFLMLHGCRPGEARALKCKDIDLEHDSITIGATFSGKTYCPRRKGRGARVAVIPIHPEMRDYLEARKKNAHPEAFVFINPAVGRHYAQAWLEDLWIRVKQDAGIDSKLRLYDATRHSYASQLVNRGVSLFTVSKLLGHSSTKVTEKYSHMNIESLRTDIGLLTLKKENVTALSLRRNKAAQN